MNLRGVLPISILVVSALCFAGCDKKTNVDDDLTKAAATAGEDELPAFEGESPELEPVELPDDWPTLEQSSESLPEPIQYTFPYPGQEGYAFDVYQDAGLSLVTYYERESGIDFQSTNFPLLLLGGTPFGVELVRATNDPLPVYEEYLSAGVEPGVKRPESDPFGPSKMVAYDEFDVTISRGDRSREIEGRSTREYILQISYRQSEENDSGEDQIEEKSFRNILWIAESLPFTPAFILPLRVTDQFFVDGKNSIGDYVYRQIQDELEQSGLVLGVELFEGEQEEPFLTLNASNVRTVEAIDFPLEWRPVVSVEQMEEMIGPLLSRAMVEFDDQEAAAQSQASIRYDGDAEGIVHGQAAYGTNELGDFALLLKAPVDGEDGDPDRDVVVQLVRPLHGVPSPGRYDVVDMVEELETLSADELRALTEDFNGFAIVHEDRPGVAEGIFYPMFEVRESTLEITESGDSLKGSIELELGGYSLGATTEPAPIQLTVEARFEAREGLHNPWESKIHDRLEAIEGAD